MMPLISSAFLNVTNACNLACRYCFVRQSPDTMTFQTAKDAADFLIRNGEAAGRKPEITFFGGEPLLGWETVIKPLTAYIREEYGKPFGLSITTNGTLLDREKLRYMRQNDIGLLLSIDGGKRTQDHNRPARNGESSFDLCARNFPEILACFPHVTFRSTVTPDTASALYENILFAEGQGFRNYFVMPNCFEAWPEERRDILLEQLHQYAVHYVEAFRAGYTPIFFGQLERGFRDILARNEAIARGGRRDGSGCQACGKCGLGASIYAGINWNGEITACQEFFSGGDAFSIGSIYTGVDEEKRRQLSWMFDSAPVYAADGRDCGQCPLDRICNGGCAANNDMITGDMHAVPAIYCDWARALFQEAVYITQTLGGEENQAFRRRWKRVLHR